MSGAEPVAVASPADPPTAPARRPRLGHRPELDGLRGIAVILVVFYHLDTMWRAAGDDVFPSGYLGVDLFLVLSGFLITVLLVGEREGRGRLDVRAFARRRALRLVPGLVALLCGALVIAVTDRLVVDRPIYDAGEVLVASAWSLSFTGNWAFLTEWGLGPLGHLWSIALEGQFYAVWVVALAIALRRRHGPRASTVARTEPVTGAVAARVAACAVLAIVAVAIWRRAAFDASPQDSFELYIGTFTRLDAPLIGAVAGLAFATGWTQHVRGWRAELCLLGGLAGVVWAAAAARPFEPTLFRGGFTLVALAAALAVTGAAHAPDRTPARVLRTRALAATGRASYSLYLWHVPVFVLVGREARALSQPLRCALGVAIAVALAAGSYRWVEQPFLRRKARLASAPAAPAAPAADVVPAATRHRYGEGVRSWGP